MSIFASRTQRVVPLPFDAPHTVTIVQLPGRHLRKAAQAKQIAAQHFVADMGGAEFRKQLEAAVGSGEADAAVAQMRADPLNSYDRDHVLQAGIKAWTYEEPVTKEHIEDLSEEAADFLARAILDLTVPARDAAGKKTAPAPSTAP